MSDPLLTSSADGVREMRLNRPEKRNAITYAMYEALYRGLTGAQADETVRVVLLTGEGAGFCAGNDLNDFLNGPEFSSEHPVMGFLHTLATFGKPLVAGVHG
ncbi:MAG: enoyl-CoA hydratase, partial [Gammaproteobacteria bacterium]